jgi:hypothetical protein
VHCPGKYFLVERDFGEDIAAEKETSMVKKQNEIPPSKLANPVQDLIKMIFNLDMMAQQMMEVGYDGTFSFFWESFFFVLYRKLIGFDSQQNAAWKTIQV